MQFTSPFDSCSWGCTVWPSSPKARLRQQADAVLQVRSIIGQVRPDRQTLLFSATMPNKVERLVQDALTSPVRVTVGEVGAANDDIRQACANQHKTAFKRLLSDPLYILAVSHATCGDSLRGIY